jgi:hypothetical protein
VYGITVTDYAELLAKQGFTCAICQRATGKTRRLAVDHDHAQAVDDGHDETTGCPKCVRGLLCKPCNRLLGHVRDDPETLRRAARYLEEPPNDRAHRRHRAA